MLLQVYLGFGYVTVEAWTDAEAGEHVLDLTSWGVGDGTEPAHIVDTVSLMREVDSDCDKNHAGENGEVQREQ